MKFPFLSLFALFLLMPGLLQASTAEAEKRLRQAIDDVVAKAESSPNNEAMIQRIRPIIKKAMSFPAMTRRAIGPGWRQFSPAQQKKAIELFSELIIRRYASRYTIGENPEITYKTAVSPAPGKVEVPTLLAYRGSKYEVVYRLEQSEGWKITDVVVEGVSFVANYRTQFNGPFQKGGPEAVLNVLANTVENPK